MSWVEIWMDWVHSSLIRSSVDLERRCWISSSIVSARVRVLRLRIEMSMKLEIGKFGKM